MKTPVSLAKPQIDLIIVLLLLGAFSIACDRFAYVSGHIRDATGRPLGGVLVTLLTADAGKTPAKRPASDRAQDLTSTSDDTGHYNVGGSVAPMRLSFLLVVEKEGYVPLQKPLLEPPTPKEDLVLAPVSPTGKESLIVGQDLGNGLKLYIPKTTPETKYFPTISELAKAARLDDLRAKALPPDETEVRVWIGFGKAPLRGYSIRNGKTESARLIQAGIGSNKVTISDLVPLEGDWFQNWRRLTEEGLLTLPDSSQLPNGIDESRVKDGETIVFESSADGIYRVYYYPYADSQNWPEAKHAATIVALLRSSLKVIEKK